MRFLTGRMPAEVRKGLALEPGERVLAYAAPVVATERALLLPEGVRVPYETVGKASWDESGLRLSLTDGTVHEVPVETPGRLPETLRERVNSTIVVNKHVSLPGRGGVRLIARRKPGGEVLGWSFLFDEGLDPDDPGLRAHAEQALETVRRSMGV
ncbi:hypothetical protein [Nonomuraea sp. NPDC050310]|uniref:hypothetical protein n=1 Tax=unclassified Nonomuraea TaxID=2593643 RepID=UPI0033DE7DF3